MTNEEIAEYLDENATFLHCTSDGNIWQMPNLFKATVALQLIGDKASSYNWNSWEMSSYPRKWENDRWVTVAPTIKVVP